jgi:uncharacterized repeat protein (TIGR03803 family)
MLALAFGLTLAAMLVQPARAQTYTVLYTFTGGPDGGQPYAGVIRDHAGNLYGTTFAAGDLTACGAFNGCGVVYKLDPSGHETVIHTFEGNSDGREPEWGNLLVDKAGNVWDTTDLGGEGSLGLGVVYKISKTGEETIMHRFAGGPDDGEEPQSGLIQGEDSTFYGTTAAGGSGPFGDCGTVYQISKSGELTILHSFIGTDGCQPTGGLVMDAAGNMYGTTTTGGTAGAGTVFKITKTGTVTTVHTFTGQPDGALPFATLTLDRAGNIYGTTPGGGDPGCTTADQGCGIVFKIDTNGQYHILHSFLHLDGGDPYAGVVLDSAGNIYGSTTGFAKYNWGSIYKLDRKGNFAKLYDFTGGADGGFPFAAMTLDETSRTLYGTAYLGGSAACGCGVVFKLTK